MKVKCKICGLKGYHDQSKISEFWASRFLYISIGAISDMNYIVICRRCTTSVLDALKYESYRIDNLYKPEIEESKKRKKKSFTRSLVKKLMD